MAPPAPEPARDQPLGTRPGAAPGAAPGSAPEAPEAPDDVAPVASPDVLWRPPPDVRRASEIGRYLAWLEQERGRRFAGYDELWQWSVTDLEGFWSSIWDYFSVGPPARPVLADASMPGATWFPGVTLNYAAHALRAWDPTGHPTGAPTGAPARGSVGDRVAIVAESQTRDPIEISGTELCDQVARARAGLARLGVGRGDRVAAYLPNVPEAVVAFLATASLGAVWSSCAPEFGTRSVVDRFRQIEPVVLVAVDRYRFGDRAIDRGPELAAIRAELPSLRATVVVPYRQPGEEPAATGGSGPGERPGPAGSLSWAELLAEPAPLSFEAVPFGHPLYVLYSSGTTGLPKPIVHGHGGILVEHLKSLALHSDLGPGQRFFWFSTTGWMMWNLLVSGLAVGATLVLFDGNPAHPDLGELWRLAERTGTTYFGTSAPFLLACRKAGLRPGRDADLSALRTVGSTGAPLPAEGFRWVYDAVGRDLVVASVSGGTDVCTAFVGASPLHPVRAGVIPCRYLGAKVEAFGPSGRPVVGQQGELVLSAPMPSMPVRFWGDDAARSAERAAYFGDFPGVWRHGDWITIHADGACVITGRSDATLNRGGVRLGTSELYAVVEALDEVADSLVVHLEDPAGGPGELALFVVPATGAVLDDGLRDRISSALRRDLSPRHVPDSIRAVAAVPRTLSNKKLELPVKRILTGTPAEQAASAGALANPEALDEFVRLARRRSSAERR